MKMYVDVCECIYMKRKLNEWASEWVCIMWFQTNLISILGFKVDHNAQIFLTFSNVMTGIYYLPYERVIH